MVIKTKKPFKKFMVKYNIKKSWVVVGVIVAIFILAILTWMMFIVI